MTTNTTATLPVLSGKNVYTDPVESENVRMFRNQLAEWCNQWVWEIGVPVMQRCSELYKNDAVRILVSKWFIANHEYMSYRVRDLRDAADNEDFSIPEVDLYADDRNAYNMALRALLIK